MMTKNIRRTIGTLLFCCLITTACSTTKPVDPTATAFATSQQQPADPLMNVERAQLERFIDNHLTGEDGVYTNLLDTAQNAESASGHEVLSESAGLLLRYYALTGQQNAYDKTWVQTKRVFDLKDGFSYRYSPANHKRYSVNAAVDDLRIIRSLHEAALAFKDKQYETEASTYGARFYAHNVKEGHLYDFYDETYRTTNSFITLCYIDFRTLALLPGGSEEKKRLSDTMRQIVNEGYLTDAFPFYKRSYQYDTHTYSEGNINTIESLLTILSLAEVGAQRTESILYLKQQVAAGTLYGQYTPDGKPANDIRSTAIYALTAMIGSEVGDTALYEDSIRQLNAFQIHKTDSPLDGGFGDSASGQAYSFDNLMALLAYAYQPH